MVGEWGRQDMNVDARDGASRRVVIWVVVVVLIVGAFIGIGKMRDDGAGTSEVDASTTAAPATTETTASTTPAETAETTPITSPTSATPPTAAPTTLANPSPISATVDLSASVESLEPEQIASFPIAPPGDLFPTAYAATAPGDRIAILDDVTGVVRFIDGTTRKDIAQYPTEIPTIGSQSLVAGYFFVGPDDVFYVNEGGDTVQSMVAYGKSGDSYTEVARVSHGIGGSTLMLGRSGVYVVGQTDPIMLYVGLDGQPSGATLDLDQLSVTSEIKDVYTVHRAEHAWGVTYIVPTDAGLPDSDTCVLCPSAYLGPNSTVVLVIRVADGRRRPANQADRPVRHRRHVRHDLGLHRHDRGKDAVRSAGSGLDRYWYRRNLRPARRLSWVQFG
jgi:hypothetical protein